MEYIKQNINAALLRKKKKKKKKKCSFSCHFQVDKQSIVDQQSNCN